VPIPGNSPGDKRQISPHCDFFIRTAVWAWISFGKRRAMAKPLQTFIGRSNAVALST